MKKLLQQHTLRETDRIVRKATLENTAVRSSATRELHPVTRKNEMNEWWEITKKINEEIVEDGFWW